MPKYLVTVNAVVTVNSDEGLEEFRQDALDEASNLFGDVPGVALDVTVEEI